jgi:hypothetical protein
MTSGGVRADEAGGQDTQRRVVYVTLDVPPRFRPKAVYAIGEVLTSIGVTPVFAPSADVGFHLHYGDRTSDADFHLPASADAHRYFEKPRPGEDPEFRFGALDRSDVPVPFMTNDGPDVVASLFYWLSGWNEYTRPDRDEHGRPTWEGSVHQHVGDRPAGHADHLREWLRRRLSEKGLVAGYEERPWHFCVTHDIDYLSRWTPGIALRTLRRWVLEPDFRRRFALRHITSDPVMEASFRMADETRRLGGRSTWFFKAAADDPRDFEYSLDSGRARNLLTVLSEAGFEIGVHPAYRSNREAARIRTEKQRVEQAADRVVTSSRQHYLRAELPTTFRALVQAGIRIDSTLGFPDKAGFRHATAHPFRVFDVERNEILPIVAVPLAFMDAGLFNREGLDVDQAVEVATWAMEEARRCGGVCVGLWHNVLWEEGDYPGWGEHFQRCLIAAHDRDANLSTLSEAAAAYKPSSDSILTTPE